MVIAYINIDEIRLWNEQKELWIRNSCTNGKNGRVLVVVLTSFGPAIINHVSNKTNTGSMTLAQYTRTAGSVPSHNHIFENIYCFLLFNF